MPLIVSMIGGLTAAIGLAGVIQPQLLIHLIQRWGGSSRFWAAVVMRLVIGGFMLVAASSCRHPSVVYTIGAIAVAAAVIILGFGERRLDAFIGWWLAKPPSLMRVSALFAMAFGGLMIFAGA
ncbi:MAG: hypothetical protein WBF93_15915 [Pirellulales bacterium]